jgi:hypothetical protein
MPGKDAKRLSKVLKNEAATEQRSLDVAIKELERLQKVQRKAAAVRYTLQVVGDAADLFPVF